MSVDSSATTGRPSANATATSAPSVIRSAIAMGRAYRRVEPTAPGQPSWSSRRGVATWRPAIRLPAAAARRRASTGERPAAREASHSAMNPASKASPAPVVSAAATGRVATSNRIEAPASLDAELDRADPRRPRRDLVADEDRHSCGTALDDDDRREREGPGVGPAARAEQAVELDGRREQQVRSHAPNELQRCLATAGQERPDRCQVEADQGAGGPGQVDGLAARQPERLAEQRVRGQVEQPGVLEPVGPQVARPEGVGGTPVGHERALAARLDEHADPTRRRTGGPGDPGRDAIGPDRLDEGTARGIASDRRDELRRHAKPGEPASGVRRRAALVDRDPARDIGAPLRRLVGREDDVEHEVAQNDRPERGPPAPPARRPEVRARLGQVRARRGEVRVRRVDLRDPAEGRHRTSIAAGLQWPSPDGPT